MKGLWLDLELRKDIDDYVTLIYALETKKNIKVISINEPSINEIKLIKYTLMKFNKLKDIKFVISGKITKYSETTDIHQSLQLKILNTNIENYNYYELNKYLKEYNNFDNTIVFCGGSLYNLSEMLKFRDNKITAFVQGGYAGESVVGESNVLEKFKGREEVPSWNMNLDINSTDNVVTSKNIKAHFISKNICHGSWMSLNDFKNKNTYLYNVLKDYFEKNKHNKKCMHDLLAFVTIFDKSFVEFKKVDLLRTNEKRKSWYSIINKNSNKKISTKLDLELFKKYINEELEKSVCKNIIQKELSF